MGKRLFNPDEKEKKKKVGGKEFPLWEKKKFQKKNVWSWKKKKKKALVPLSISKGRGKKKRRKEEGPQQTSSLHVRGEKCVNLKEGEPHSHLFQRERRRGQCRVGGEGRGEKGLT